LRIPVDRATTNFNQSGEILAALGVSPREFRTTSKSVRLGPNELTPEQVGPLVALAAGHRVTVLDSLKPKFPHPDGATPPPDGSAVTPARLNFLHHLETLAIRPASRIVAVSLISLKVSPGSGAPSPLDFG
jgi:hypothetical protein